MSSIHLTSLSHTKIFFRADNTHDSTNQISEYAKTKYSIQTAINHYSEACDSGILDPAGKMAAAESLVYLVAVCCSAQMVVNKGGSAANKQARVHEDTIGKGYN